MNDIYPVMTSSGLIKEDNTICDYTPEILSSMKPAFMKDYGSVTKGNSCTIVDFEFDSILTIYRQMELLSHF